MSENNKPGSMLAKPNEMSSVKKIFGVVSGKGGVGKSMVTSQLAVLMRRMGYRTGVLDADITGPSIPKAFGVHEKATYSEIGIFPVRSRTGIELMSINLLMENETDPVLWRGPIIAGAVGQFWTDVIWKEIDFLFVDMPPGTGDVPLTVFQSIPLNGILVVTSPQELVAQVVEKAVKMAQQMEIPMLGIIENMSYVLCPDCQKKIYLFGEGKTDEAAARYHLPVLAKLPIDPTLSAMSDAGKIEDYPGEGLAPVADRLAQDLK